MGEVLGIGDLPRPNETRWTPRRKAEVVSAVRGGLLTHEQAYARYALTMTELIGWLGAFERSGVAGLRSTRLQFYRDRFERRGF